MMNLKQIVLTCLLLATLRVTPQIPDWAWARNGAGADNCEAADMAVDASGNVYITGYFSSASFSLSASTLTNSGAQGTREYFLARYDRAGNLVWAKRAQGADDDEGLSVAVDAAGNIYTTGAFESPTITFGTTVLTNNSNNGLSDLFVVKYNPAGNVLWAGAYGGGQEETGNSIVADASGNTYVTGNFYSLSVQFGSYGVVNGGLSDAFVTKFAAGGTPLWSKRIGGGMSDNGKDIGFDGSGNVYVTGDFNSSSIASFSPGITNAGGYDIFLAKYDPAGNNIFGKAMGGTGNENVFALASGAGGDFFITGSFESTALVSGTVSLSKGSTRDLFFMKLNPSGNALWGARAGGNLSSQASALALDGAGNLYATGYFNTGSITFGSTPALNNSGGLDAFIVKMSGTTGAAVWSRQTNSAGQEKPEGIALDGGGFVHIAGAFTQSLTLGDHVLPGGNSLNVFVTKLCFPPAAPLSATGATVCFGAPGTLSAVTPPGTTASWFTAAAGGNPLLAGSSSFTTFSGGTYYVASRDTANGCGMNSSQRVAVTFSVHPAINPSVSVSGHTLIASGQGTVQAWYNCIQNTSITGQTSGSYVINASGTYAVIMTANGCADTSACTAYSYTPGTSTVIVETGIKTGTMRAWITVFPNPGRGGFTLSASQAGKYGIFNLAGQAVAFIELKEEEANTIYVRDFEPGLYFIRGMERGTSFKLVVNR